MLIRFYLLLQKILPHHLTSRLIKVLSRISWQPLKNLQIRLYARWFGVNLDEAESADPDFYSNLDAFFTRALKPGVRVPDPAPETLLMPADGRISACGAIDGDRLFQAKDRHYHLAELLGNPAHAKVFLGGSFATVYLQPRNYHRVHMPIAGTLRETLYIPGRLFSVAPVTVEGIERLFARNERLVCHFDTSIGPVVVILVGAMLVSGIDTVWGGMETAQRKRQPDPSDYRSVTPRIRLDRFEELARFHMGSTAIVLFPRGKVDLDLFQIGQEVKVGQRLGRIRTEAAGS